MPILLCITLAGISDKRDFGPPHPPYFGTIWYLLVKNWKKKDIFDQFYRHFRQFWATLFFSIFWPIFFLTQEFFFLTQKCTVSSLKQAVEASEAVLNEKPKSSASSRPVRSLNLLYQNPLNQ